MTGLLMRLLCPNKALHLGLSNREQLELRFQLLVQQAWSHVGLDKAPDGTPVVYVPTDWLRPP